EAGLYACVAGFGYLDGHVYDAGTMAPIPGATVTAVRDEGGTWADDTDASGYYTMNVAVGTFDVTAAHPHYTPATSTDVSVVTDTVTTVNFYLVARGRLFGYVTDYDNGMPIQGAVVTADDGTWDDTDATGYYEMYLDEGTHTVTATMENYAPEVATVNIVSGEDTQQNFALQAAIAFIPSPLHVSVPWQSTYSDQVTLLNRLPWDYDFEFIERPGGFIPGQGGFSVHAHIPASAPTHDPAAKGSAHATAREARDVTFSGGLPAQGSYDVLLVSPDSTMGDISSLLTTLAAFPDLNVTVWDNYQGNPTAADLAPYQVVIFGNDYTWESAGLDKVAVGNALADYIDNGGKVIESLYAQSCFDQWGFGGRYMTDGYSPFTCATTDNWNPATMNILQPTHPVMQGVTSIQDFWGHQNPGLRSGAELLASWSGSGYNAVAVNENVVALNQLIFHSADWAGDVGTLLHNAIVWLAGAGEDVAWFGQDPVSGTVPAESSLGVTVAFTATYDAGVNQPGDYYCTLRVWGEPSLEIPVTMTVLPPADLGKVEGYVTDNCSGEPLEGVHVAIVGGDPITETWTDESGRYVAWLVPGTYSLEFTLDGYLGYDADVPIVAGQVTTLDVNLVPDRPCIALDPTMFEFWVVSGTQASDVLSIINNGGQDLVFSIFEMSGTVGFLQSAPVSHARITSGNEAKVETTTGGAWPDASGGPDPFGYTFSDSDEPGGPAFDWIEISGTGQNLGLGDDDSIFPLDLPFPFNFYGVDYNQIAVGSNGTVYFVDQYLGLSNVCLPGDGGYGVWDFIAGMWDDLNPAAAGGVYYQALTYKGTDIAVVEWYQVPRFGLANYMTWEVILFPNGSILLQYQAMNGETGSSATVGIQGYWEDPSYYLQYSCNAPALADNLAICFAYPGSPGCIFGEDVPWVWEEPVTGTVPALSTGEVAVTVTSYLTEPLPLGTYT
ncbi:MAG: carboxypeptidase regulatory-like domain-containing protein, partial [Chloroflexia bacterium]